LRENLDLSEKEIRISARELEDRLAEAMKEKVSYEGEI